MKRVRNTPKEKSFLPDEIVANILISLPVKSLIRYLLVCKGWRDIILARDFVDLYLKTSIPVILVSSLKKFFALDKWWESTRNRLITFPSDSGDFRFGSYIKSSHAGFIVISRYLEIYILNPARPSDECVKITLPERIFCTKICAVYYHPSLQEYVSLLKIETSDSYPRQPQLVQYKLLTLGSNPSLKTISSPSSEYTQYNMKEYANPVYVNSYVYWMLMHKHWYNKHKGDILEFDIIREEFVVIPCPAALSNTVCSNDQTQLLNRDGVLIFVLVLPSTITIWSLEDHKEHLWTSIEYTVSLQVSHGSSTNLG